MHPPKNAVTRHLDRDRHRRTFLGLHPAWSETCEA